MACQWSGRNTQAVSKNCCANAPAPGTAPERRSLLGQVVAPRGLNFTVKKKKRSGQTKTTQPRDNG